MGKEMDKEYSLMKEKSLSENGRMVIIGTSPRYDKNGKVIIKLVNGIQVIPL